MYGVQLTESVQNNNPNPVRVLTENRFEAVRFLNTFFKEDTWIGIRNFVDTGNGPGRLQSMTPFEGNAFIDDETSTRFRHMKENSVPSTKESDILFSIKDNLGYSKYSVWSPFQVQYDESRDALYVLTKLKEQSTIYVFAHRPVSLMDKKRVGWNDNRVYRRHTPKV